METNCYHGRDNSGRKLFGGMLHASNHDQAAERATAGLTVKTTPSGRLYFTDKEGREVSLYISVHPEHTAQGQAALRTYEEEQRAKAALAQFDEDDEDEE